MGLIFFNQIKIAREKLENVDIVWPKLNRKLRNATCCVISILRAEENFNHLDAAKYKYELQYDYIVQGSIVRTRLNHANGTK